MRPLLMHQDRDFEAELPDGHETLTDDLDLDVVVEAMAGGDRSIADTARAALLAASTDPATIEHRRQVLADCLGRPDAIREMRRIAAAALEGKRTRHLFYVVRSPDSVLATSVRALDLYLPLLRKLRRVVDESGGGFRSPGLAAFGRAVDHEFNEGTLAALESHMRRLRFPHGVLLSARLGSGNIGTDYTLLLPRRRRWRERLMLWRERASDFTVPSKDDSALRGLARVRGRGIAGPSEAVAAWCEATLGFFRSLHTELGFYVGCLNLHDRLVGSGRPVCFPVTGEPGDLGAEALYDVCLALRVRADVVGNDLEGDGTRLVIVTGANGGGKSTFLRSVGLAHLMMQAGMFVGARAFRAAPAAGVFTHFTRGEDSGLRRGKLDEELERMDRIADRVAPGSLLLCNESFSSTNEREGSEIAHQVVTALTEAGVRVCFVTHMYELARRIHDEQPPGALFLRAERLADGTRTFRIHPAEPLSTSFGPDLLRRVLGEATHGDGD